MPKGVKGFQKGHKHGGNTLAKVQRRIMSAIGRQMTVEQADKLAKRLIVEANKGRGWAMHELLDRVMGKAVQPLQVDSNQPMNFTMQIIVGVPMSAPGQPELPEPAVRDGFGFVTAKALSSPQESDNPK